MSSTAMSIPLSFTTVNSSIINHRPLPRLVRPSVRIFRMSLSAGPHLLPLCSANSSHTDAFLIMLFWANAKPYWMFTICVSLNILKRNWIRCVLWEFLEMLGMVTSPESSDFGSSYVEKEGLTRLKRYGIAGILSYGLLNTVYYLTTFLVVWFYVTPAPGRMGYLAAVERFLKVMAMVWAGSQVTKLIRAGGRSHFLSRNTSRLSSLQFGQQTLIGCVIVMFPVYNRRALALAPFVDRGLSWFTAKFGFESQGKAFMAIAGLCFGLAFLMFVIVTLLSA
ncbi:hypothetical protein Sango_0160300 [Sesamum angolense]|uniref:Uncharacterized protein n=1 Tax=Sesamum angolense TaxID=2727404 RepID=A0AAE1XFK3_9LAMI|nr:hypothetical protein Sango_0160300 [Sesamum angolense]